MAVSTILSPSIVSNHTYLPPPPSHLSPPTSHPTPHPPPPASPSTSHLPSHLPPAPLQLHLPSPSPLLPPPPLPPPPSSCVGAGGRLEVGRCGWAGWQQGAGPYRQAHPRRKPKTTPTVPNRTMTPMIVSPLFNLDVEGFRV